MMEDEPELPLVADVEGLADHPPAAEVGGPHPDRPGQVPGQVGLRLLDR